MPNLSIKDVPEEWAEALRQRAARHHRSLQGELMAIVEQAIQERTGEAGAPVPGPRAADNRSGARIVGQDSRGWPIVRQGWKTPDDVFAEMRAAGAKIVRGQPLAVDIIRQDRKTR